MNVQHPPTEVTESRERHSYARVPGRWLLLARGIWITLVILTLGTFFASLPVYRAQLQTPCAGTACGYGVLLTPEQAGVLKGMGLSIGDYAASYIAFTLATIMVCLVVSTVIIWRRSGDRMALLVALMLVTLGPINTMSSLLAIPSPWQLPAACLYFLALALCLFVYLLFPTGQFVPRWTRWTAVVSLAVQVPSTFFPNAPFTLNTNALEIGYLVLLGELGILVVVQLYRYRHISSPVQRQQTKWVVFGLAVPGIVSVGGYGLLLFPAFGDHSSPYGSLYQLALAAIVGTCLPLFLPLSFGFAMLRYRLWDIDIIINRTLVYGLLTAIVVGVYVLVVGILSTLLHTFGNSLIALLATGLVAVLFQPLRTRLQRMINRLMYGERDDPYAVLSYLGSRLEATLAPEAILPTIVETAAQALKQVRQNQDLLAHAVIPADVPRLQSWGHLAQLPPSGHRSATAALFLPGGSQRR